MGRPLEDTPHSALLSLLFASAEARRILSGGVLFWLFLEISVDRDLGQRGSRIYLSQVGEWLSTTAGGQARDKSSHNRSGSVGEPSKAERATSVAIIGVDV